MFFGIYMITVADPQILWNDGFYPLVDVTIPDGSFWKPKHPAALNARNHGIGRVFDLFGGLLGQTNPALLNAAGFSSSPALHVLGQLLLAATARASGSSCTRSASAASPAGRSATARTATRCGRASSTSPASSSSRTTRCGSRSGRPSPTPAAPGCTAAATASTSPTASSSPGTIAIHDDRWLTYPWGVNGGEPGARGTKWLDRADGTPRGAAQQVPRRPGRARATCCTSSPGAAAAGATRWSATPSWSRWRSGAAWSRADGRPAVRRRASTDDGARRRRGDGVAARASCGAGRAGELPVFDMGPPLARAAGPLRGGDRPARAEAPPVWT